ncbi:unnamed protein product [Miscanthus lutarioriparius]|uniref:Uncharacterized protein n=1 Tax=Miscanthus lutarioriparius TaxID=422564 RepID=A0A811N084_9POAL|nr:unnamed protein product [Miscanthus lutarioriparius]
MEQREIGFSIFKISNNKQKRRFLPGIKVALLEVKAKVSIRALTLDMPVREEITMEVAMVAAAAIEVVFVVVEACRVVAMAGVAVVTPTLVTCMVAVMVDITLMATAEDTTPTTTIMAWRPRLA